MHVLRKLSFAIGLATVMATQHAMALGLGAAEVKSALNQPLQADIRLTSVEDMTADDLIVRLASVSAFEKDRKSTRLNSSHVAISYAVFCLKKKNTKVINVVIIK